jgi:hypothetical protein
VVPRIVGETGPGFEVEQQFDRIGPKVREFSRAEDGYVKKYRESLQQLEERQLSVADFESILEGELLPAIHSQRVMFSKLSNLDPLDQPLAKDVIRYISIREESWKLLLKGLQENNPELVRAARDRERGLEPLAARVRAEYNRMR